MSSSATAVVVLAVLVALVIVTVALIAGGYVPYRRYKNRMTETADFRFVDLSENGKPWDRFKLKANQFMDYFRQRRHNEKIGLVNLGSVPMLEERRLFYGTNTLTQFAGTMQLTVASNAMMACCLVKPRDITMAMDSAGGPDVLTGAEFGGTKGLWKST